MVDRQNRHGYKGTGVSTQSDRQLDRKERLRRLAMETIDLTKDPYFMQNHVGTFECRLCLTLHTNEGSYLAHTQGKKHQVNLARRLAKEKEDAENGASVPGASVPGPQPTAAVKKNKTIKIGRPGYRVTKERDPKTMQKALLFEVDYPECPKGTMPKHRFMSAFEQKVEAADKDFQYLIFAAEPYESVAFKIPNMEIDRRDNKFTERWDAKRKKFTVQVFFKEREMRELPNLPTGERRTNLAFHGGGGFVRG